MALAPAPLLRAPIYTSDVAADAKVIHDRFSARRLVLAFRDDGCLHPAPDLADPRDTVRQQRCERGLYPQR